MLNDVRGYLQLAGTLVEAGLEKAKESLLSLPAMSDRDTVVALVRSEIDQVVGRMGFVREDELAALRRHVERLEQQLSDLEEQTPSAAPAKAAAKPSTKSPTAAKSSAAPATPVVKKRKKVVVEGAK